MDGLVSTDEGRAYCLAELGRIYLVYAEGTRSVLLEPDGESDTHYAVTRFDPSTGIGSALAEQGGDTIRLVCPDEQDWAFIVQALASSTE